MGLGGEGGKRRTQTDSYLLRDAEIFQLLTTSAAIIQTGTSWIPALARTQCRDGCSAHRRSCQYDLSYTTSSLPPFPDHRGGDLKFSLLNISHGTFQTSRKPEFDG